MMNPARLCYPIQPYPITAFPPVSKTLRPIFRWSSPVKCKMGNKINEYHACGCHEPLACLAKHCAYCV